MLSLGKFLLKPLDPRLKGFVDLALEHRGRIGDARLKLLGQPFQPGRSLLGFLPGRGQLPNALLHEVDLRLKRLEHPRTDAQALVEPGGGFGSLAFRPAGLIELVAEQLDSAVRLLDQPPQRLGELVERVLVEHARRKQNVVLVDGHRFSVRVDIGWRNTHHPLRGRFLVAGLHRGSSGRFHGPVPFL